MLDFVQFSLIWSIFIVYGLIYRPLNDTKYINQWQLIGILLAISLAYIW